MLPTYKFKRRFVFLLSDSAAKIAETVLSECFGAIEPRYIRIKKRNESMIVTHILAPDRSVLIKAQIELDAFVKPILRDPEGVVFEFIYNTTTTITPSERLAEWILSKLASLEDEKTPGIKDRYEIATKTLRALKKKSQIFGIFSIVFCIYFITATIALIGAALTHSSQLKKYGLPTFITLTAVCFSIAIAFAVATFCMKKEIRKADVAFSSVHRELLALRALPVEELAQMCNQYLQERKMGIEVIKPTTVHEIPPEVINAGSRQNEEELLGPS
ncbi:hypothetical protein [Neorickettsia sp. 179522]|uniref:hypothetical protein n=1 Tax=Neorickettsia sp. 179522 TaxID=1714371 RepID=UPI0007980269|nr:hypothetical protein [Neorickettsia sp. 179522]KYH12751.1 hypothetical protein AS219_03190 [Neorickettsia sp. 179522]